jgi:hypothetical protein
MVKIKKASDEYEGRTIDPQSQQIRKGSGSKKGLNDRSI